MASHIEPRLAASRMVPATSEYTPYSAGTSTRVNIGTAIKEVRDDDTAARRYHAESRPMSSICLLKPRTRFHRRTPLCCKLQFVSRVKSLPVPPGHGRTTFAVSL